MDRDFLENISWAKEVFDMDGDGQFSDFEVQNADYIMYKATEIEQQRYDDELNGDCDDSCDSDDSFDWDE